MSGPIATASAVLAARLGEALAGSGLLTDPDRLEVEVASAIELSGEVSEILTAAQLFTQETRTVRALLGSGSPRYVVERDLRLEVVVASPDKAWRDATIDGGLTACARLVADDPTLGGATERLELSGSSPDDLPPNGVKTGLTFTVRVRSSDPLGLTA